MPAHSPIGLGVVQASSVVVDLAKLKLESLESSNTMHLAAKRVTVCVCV